MLKSKLTFVGCCLITTFTLSQCGGSPGTGAQGEAGAGGTAAAGNTGSGSAGTTGAGNTTGAAGTTGTGNTTGAAGTTAAAGRGGAGNATGAAGTTGNAGTTGAAGTTGVAGATGGGGMAGGAAGAGVRTDMGGIPLARPGDSTNVSRKYLNLGEMRLINNRWGSDELGCSGTTQRVFINSDRTIGWEFNRPACGLGGQKPDYPEVEFGVGPFGANNSLLTTPAFSSTTLLPKQIKDITSAAVTLDTMTI